MFKLKIARSAMKELHNFSDTEISKIREKILELKKFPDIQNCKKLQNEEKLFRLRVGKFRVIFAVFKSEEIIKITRVRLRNEKTYKNL